MAAMPPSGPPGTAYASGPWCRTSFPLTMKITSSQMLVAWSAIRSMWRETRIRSIARGWWSGRTS